MLDERNYRNHTFTSCLNLFPWVKWVSIAENRGLGFEQNNFYRDQFHKPSKWKWWTSKVVTPPRNSCSCIQYMRFTSPQHLLPFPHHNSTNPLNPIVERYIIPAMQKFMRFYIHITIVLIPFKNHPIQPVE